MDVFKLFIVFSLIFLGTEAFDANCTSVMKCGLDIQFPFRVQGQRSQLCDHPGFELVCKRNKTIIQFPSYGDLVVKSISYDIRKLDLLDPKNCVHEVFLNLNLSLTPFHYYYVVKNYTYLNCSAVLSPSFAQVPCLSGFGYHVYVVESSLAIPASCKAVKTIAIPFSYSPYLSDNSFGLGLTWDSAGCKYSEAEGFRSKCFKIAHGKVFSISIFIFMVATLITVKTSCYKKLDKKNNKSQLEVVKFLGNYERFKPARDHEAGVKGLSNQIETAGHENTKSDFKVKLLNETCISIYEQTGNDGKGSMNEAEPE
uniref:RING-type E3 ubiquitin transferase n=1 Tax=Davidia involucrata TaxID=16924 RepID=A0A5B6YMB7_DAVIN